MELPEKIESIAVLYLAGLTWPDYFAAATQIAAGEADDDKSGQIIQVVCGDADLEDPPYSGNFWHQLDLQLRTPFAVQTESEAGSADAATAVAPIDKHKAVAAVLYDAIVIADLVAQLNAVAAAQSGALADFAVIGFTDRHPQRGQTEDFWLSGFTIRFLICANANAR